MAKSFCNFCSLSGSNLGFQNFVKTSGRDLEEIVKKFKNERQINDRIILSLGEGFRDEELPLFQMGHGFYPKKFYEAADYLLERSYPDIVDESQVGLISIPETYLPKYTRGVDPEHFNEKLRQWYGNDFYDNKEYKTEKREYRGDHAERLFYDAIHKVLDSKKSKSFLLQGCQLPTIKDPKQIQESDFLLINADRKYILSLEIKNNLFSDTDGKVKVAPIQKGVEQISKIKNILETFFCTNIDMRDMEVCFCAR